MALAVTIGLPQEAAVQCLVSGRQVFAFASPRVVALGSIRQCKWSPSESTAALSITPVIETPAAEAIRLKKGEVRPKNALGSILLYTPETGKTLRIIPAWDTAQETDERIGWIDEQTLVISATPRKPEAGELTRIYVFDANSGAIVKTVATPFAIIGSGPCYVPSKGGAAQVVLADIGTGQSGVMELHILSREGLSDPMLRAKSIFGGRPSSDGTAIVWSVDERALACRWANGKLLTTPVSEEEISAMEAREMELLARPLDPTIEPLSPIGRKVALKASRPVPLQPDELIVGLAQIGKPDVGVNLGSKGFIYEIDGVIFSRFIAELSGAAAEKAQDQAEQAVLERWAKTVVSEYLSWTYGFSPLPDPAGFPFGQMASLKEFSSRLKWLGKNEVLFQLRGEKWIGTFGASGAAAYARNRTGGG